MKTKWIMIGLVWSIFLLMPYEKAIPVGTFAISPIDSASQLITSVTPSFIMDNPLLFILGAILIYLIYTKVKE